MRQQGSLGADTSREPVPKMAAIVPQVQVQASPKTNGNHSDPGEVPDITKTSKVVRNFKLYFLVWIFNRFVSTLGFQCITQLRRVIFY